MGIPILGDLFKEVFGKVGDVVSEVVVDKDKRNQIKADLTRLELELTDRAEERMHKEMLAQIDVNKVEAGSGSLFVAGWRPAVGWVGVTGLAYSFVIEPFMSFIANVSFGYQGEFPELPTESLLFLITGMLGFGGLRSWEKIKGVKTEEPSPVANPAVAGVSGYETRTKIGVPISAEEEKRITTPPENTPWVR